MVVLDLSPFSVISQFSVINDKQRVCLACLGEKGVPPWP